MKTDTEPREVQAEEVDIARLVAAKPGGRARRFAWIAAVLLAAGAAAAVVASRLGSRAAAVTYETQPARRGNLTVSIAATGKLQPINQVSVGSELSGTVRAVEADVNDRVKTGQVLARLDTTRLEAQIQQAEASLASARAKVGQTRATVLESSANLARLRRLRDLTGGKTPSVADLEAAEASLARAQADQATAEASVSQAQAALAVSRTDLAKAVIRAPTGGLVLTRSVEPGQTVAASLQAPELFVIAEDLTRMELHVSVDEADVGRVKEGQAATFTVAAYPDRKYEARLTRVHFGSTTTAGVVTYETVLRVSNPDLSLRPGMTGTADIVVERVADGLLVPNAALRFTPEEKTSDAGSKTSLLSALLPRPPMRMRNRKKPDGNGAESGGRARVWILKDGRPAPVRVVLGATDGVATEVKEGDLQPGAELVVGATTPKS